MAKQRRINIQKRITDGKTKYLALYFLPDGSSRSAGTFTNKIKARGAAEVAWEKSRKADWVDPQKGATAVATYAEQTWLPNLMVERKSWIGYESTYRVHIKPLFGDRALGSILPTEVEGWLNGMEERGVGRSTQRMAYTIFNLILRKAKRDRLIPAVPTEDVTPRPVPKQPVRIFSHRQWESFIAAVPKEYRLLLEVAVATGLRASELRPLCPAQVNWARQRILVDRGLVQVPAKDDGEMFVPKAYPKGKTSREVSCDKATLKLLAQEIMRLGLSKDSEEPIFRVNGKPFANEFTNALFAQAREKAGIDANLTMKHLRSSRASWLLKETGGDIVRVQQELGHADIQTTMKYLAVVDEIETDNASAFEDFLREDTQ